MAALNVQILEWWFPFKTDRVRNRPIHNRPVHNRPVHNRPVHNRPTTHCL